MSSDWEISGSPVFASVIAFFFLLFQAESAVLRKLFRLSREATSYPAKMNRGKAKQSSYTLHYGGCFVLGFLARAIVGIVGVGKEAQVSLRVHKLPTREACAWLTVKLE